jgi:hypothetical protein
MNYKDYKTFWDGMPQYHDLFTNERLKNKSESEREEMVFVYLVVTMLRSVGLLDSHNLPYTVNSSEIQRNRPVEQDWSRAMRITNSVRQIL